MRDLVDNTEAQQAVRPEASREGSDMLVILRVVVNFLADDYSRTLCGTEHESGEIVRPSDREDTIELHNGVHAGSAWCATGRAREHTCLWIASKEGKKDSGRTNFLVSLLYVAFTVNMVGDG